MAVDILQLRCYRQSSWVLHVAIMSHNMSVRAGNIDWWRKWLMVSSVLSAAWGNARQVLCWCKGSIMPCYTTTYTATYVVIWIVTVFNVVIQEWFFLSKRYMLHMVDNCERDLVNINIIQSRKCLYHYRLASIQRQVHFVYIDYRNHAHYRRFANLSQRT